jgi:enoyl-CoA hydratase
MGLVNRVVPAAELESYVKSMTDMICANAPLTIKAVKFTVGEIVREESKRDLARSTELVEQCFTSRDYTEGRTAFMEKRKPVFTGS